MKKRILFLITVLMAGCFNCAVAEPSAKGSNTEITPEMRARMQETQDKQLQNAGKQEAAWKQWFANLKPFNVYGQIADDAGRSVEGARVKIQWEHTGYNQLGQIVTRWVDADKEGRFVVEMGRADIEPHIYEIKCEGYEFSKDFSPYFAKDQTGQNNPLLSTTKEHPVVLVLRKKGGTTLLLENKDVDFQFLAGESGKAKGHDFVQEHRIKNVEKPVLNGETLVCDLQIQATFNTGTSTWTVVMKPGTSGGGIMATDTLLYEAPQEGYQPEVSFVAEDRKMPKGSHIYLKSRDAAIYTRLDIDYVIANEKFFRFRRVRPGK